MLRSKLISKAALAGLAFLALALPTRAGTIAADALPLPNRVATADAVVVGKVTAIEDKSVMVAPFPGARNKTEFRIAVLAISDALMAPKKVMKLRLGFVPIPPGVAISPPPFQPVIGQEGCFFLTKHEAADFFVASGQLNFVNKNDANFGKDIALIKRCTKILEDPNAALKAKDVEDRFLAAAMLVARYRTRKSASAKTEPIEATQSKLILQALAAADWTPSPDFTRLSPLMVLNRLPLTAKDGWAPPPPTEAKAYAAYAQQWLKDHAQSYRIQKFVTEQNP
jgi:hypothetical protein